MNSNSQNPSTEDLDWLALHLVQDLGTQTLRNLLRFFGDASTILRTDAASLIKQAGLSPVLASRIPHARQSTAFQIEERLVRENGVCLKRLNSPEYPQTLAQISVPPALLYWQGTLQKLTSPCIAFVGSRNCTQYGRKHTRRLVQELASCLPDAIIVSGLAKGIDTVAHQTALDCGLRTVAVLGSGLLSIYPNENKGLAKAIFENGALVSEYAMTQRPHARNFPIRNRIVSGISLGVVITEAGLKSGARLTAGYALQQNREIFALPGSVESKASQGVNQMISRNQAKLIVSAQDILDELNLIYQRPSQSEFDLGEKNTASLNLSELSEAQQKVIEALKSLDSDVDELCQRTSIDVSVMLGLLVEMELLGYVECLPGQHYRLPSSLIIK